MRYFEDFVVGESVDLGTRTVTEAEIIGFAQQFDPQPFHIDPEKAKDSFFGGLVASGWHTCAIFMRMYYDNFLHECASMGAGGMEEIRWLLPVRANNTLRGKLEILATRPSKSRPIMGMIRIKGEIFNQNEEAVLRVIFEGFMRKRTA
jgi:acyl dehydratase